jgi:hypothetical protein
MTAAAFVRIPFITSIYRLIGRFAQQPHPQLQGENPRALEGVRAIV